jgi:hypothetical protein
MKSIARFGIQIECDSNGPDSMSGWSFEAVVAPIRTRCITVAIDRQGGFEDLVDPEVL